MEFEEYIMHYGVKGMRWKVHKVINDVSDKVEDVKDDYVEYKQDEEMQNLINNDLTNNSEVLAYLAAKKAKKIKKKVTRKIRDSKIIAADDALQRYKKKKTAKNKKMYEKLAEIATRKKGD